VIYCIFTGGYGGNNMAEEMLSMEGLFSNKRQDGKFSVFMGNS